jgi:hypothetical protein
MINEGVVFFILAVIVIWLVILSIILYRIFRYFQNLSKGIESGNLLRLLDKVLEEEAKNTKDVEIVKKLIVKIEDEGKLHLQKIGLVRFNPFKELGGDHSFSLALLDGNEDGIIITGLHTRERTRVYSKDIRRGKSSIELAKEEVKALKIAQKS